MKQGKMASTFSIRTDERGEGTIRRVASVRIKIAPYKKNPECYNIWLENGMGLGIQL